MIPQSTPLKNTPLAPLVYSSLTAMAAALLLPFPRLAMIHTILAVGVLPLILAAMIYFTSTLTRSQPAQGWAWLPPWLALVAGFLAVAGFTADYRALIPAGVVALLAVLLLGYWIQGRRRQCLGSPHGGLLWYQMALVCLVLALSAAVTGMVFPAWYAPLRPVHLHLNMLGFIGLTALGTLQVLLPTVAHYHDPATPRRLGQDLPWAMAGALLVAVGSGWSVTVAVLGAVLGLFPPLRLALAVFRHRQACWQGGGAGHSLVFALLGYVIVWPLGALAHWLPQGHSGMVPFFILAFLLPLVTGAASHLLPLWWRPQPQDAPWRQQAQQRLAYGGGWRGVLFLVAAMGQQAGAPWAMPLAGGGVLLFVGQLVRARFL